MAVPRSRSREAATEPNPPFPSLLSMINCQPYYLAYSLHSIFGLYGCKTGLFISTLLPSFRVVFFLKKVGFAIGPKLTDPGWHKLRAKNNLPPVTAVPGRCSPTLRLKMTSFLLEYPQPLPPGGVLGNWGCSAAPAAFCAMFLTLNKAPCCGRINRQPSRRKGRSQGLSPA